MNKPALERLLSGALVLLVLGLGGCQRQFEPTAAPPAMTTPPAAETLVPSLTSPAPSEDLVPQVGYGREGMETVPYPRLEVYLHGAASYCYISVSDALAAEVEAALQAENILEGNVHTTEILGYESYSREIDLPQIYYAQALGETNVPVFRCTDGRMGFVEDLGTFTEATGPVSELLTLAEEVMGWDLDVGIRDFSDVCALEAWLGDKLLFTVTDPAQLEAFGTFLQTGVAPTTAGKTEDPIVELRCTGSDGQVRTLFADPWRARLWLPPCFYYHYDRVDAEDPDSLVGPEALLELFGMERWPDTVDWDPLDFFNSQYPREYFDALYQELRVVPPG